MKNKYQRDYPTGTRNVQRLIDEIFAEKMIPANDSVRLLDEIMEGMDTQHYGEHMNAQAVEVDVRRLQRKIEILRKAIKAIEDTKGCAAVKGSRLKEPCSA